MGFVELITFSLSKKKKKITFSFPYLLFSVLAEHGKYHWLIIIALRIINLLDDQWTHFNQEISQTIKTGSKKTRLITAKWLIANSYNKTEQKQVDLTIKSKQFILNNLCLLVLQWVIRQSPTP